MRYFGRDKKILQLSQHKTVLHLGCVGFTDLEVSERINLSQDSLHFALSQVSQVVGVDDSQEVISYYREKKIFDNILYGDVENLPELDLERTFDVIVAGDIIEHISNPGLLLEGIKRFCREDTLIIITTPHSFGLLNFIRFAFKKFSEGREHVMTFNIFNISNLLERHGFLVNSIDACYQNHALQCGFLFKLGKNFFERFPQFGGTLFVVAQLPATSLR